ncbi:hypothetical protein, partial [Streptomyces sp. PTD5-9]|uniref:hypothetical protein n=1 Tax=Streptomyces sp. PTD5-9 TaxID=3120150 RepID=UPI00300BBA97
MVLAACLGVGLFSAPGQAAEQRSAVSAATAHPRTGDAEKTGRGVPEPGGPSAESPAAPADDADHFGRNALKAADRP